MAVRIRRVRLVQLFSLIFVLCMAFIVTRLKDVAFEESHHSRRLLEEESEELAQYPTDAFTKSERQNGAVLFHVLGVMYMFTALAIVVDEFFVPALDVICEALHLQDDVAGATFMAAGGSAPELATSFIGTFISQSNVGFGTIVGSAVFNILFVIGTCAMYAPTAINLLWWPLARDSTFYAISLGALIGCFNDRIIETWEAAILFSLYLIYVVFMAYNQSAEIFVRSLLGLPPPEDPEEDPEKSVNSIEATSPREEIKMRTLTPDPTKVMDRKISAASTRNINRAGSPCTIPRYASQLHMRAGSGAQHPTKMSFGLHTLFSSRRLVKSTINLHSIPKHEIKMDIKKKLDRPKSSRTDSKGRISIMSRAQRNWVISKIKIMAMIRKKKTFGDIVFLAMAGNCSRSYAFSKHNLDDRQLSNEVKGPKSKILGNQSKRVEEEENDDDSEDDGAKPMDLGWPSTFSKQITYILLSPLTFLLYYTVPDVRREGYDKYVSWTFALAILYIGGFSYLMVWWVTVVGDALSIPSQVMGLTILAIGTSVPDLLESVVVAKQGKGDMAVSSSVGSNIFDVTVGLPLPWLLYTIITNSSIEVGTDGLFISVILLFGMLVSCITTIAFAGWKMSKKLGIWFFILWVIFVGISLIVEFVV